MVAASTSASPEMRAAGLAFIAGIILSIVASIFTPGGMLIDPVEATDFNGAVAVLSSNEVLAHGMTLLMIAAMLLETFGLLALFRLVGRRGSLADAALRFGLVASLLGWSVFILSQGVRHMVIHVVRHGVGGGPEMAGQLQDFGIAVYSVMGGAHFAFLAIYPFASILLGLGLASRFRAMNVFKVASYGMVVSGVLALINVGIAQHVHDADFTVLILISNSLLLLGALWFLIIAVGMYQGQSGLVPDESAG